MGFFDFLKRSYNEFLLEKQQRKEKMLQWQNLILQENRDELILSEQQLKSCTAQQAEDDLRIINDCVKLIESTLKPDVFFMRLKLLFEKTEHLCMLEPYMSFAGAKPSDAYIEVSQNHQEAVRLFLIRYFSDTFDKAEAMKTEKGRIGKYQRFYDSLQEYYFYMNEENIDYVETKYKAYTKDRKG